MTTPQRYHISKKSGLPNICKAKTASACKADPAFGEDKPPHFESKEAAKQYIEEKLEKKHGEKSARKITKSNTKTREEKQREKDMETIAAALEYEKKLEKNKYSYMGNIENLDMFMDEHLPGFNSVRSIAKVNYANEMVLEKDGNYYIMTTHGGVYFNHSILDIEPVVKKAKTQVETEAEQKDEIKDQEIVDSIYEVMDARKKSYEDRNDKAYYSDMLYPADPHAEYSPTNYPTFYVDVENFTHEREDGSKIHVFRLEAEGDQSLYDVPSPVSVPVEMYENGERENARVMENGLVVYDTRSDKGVLLAHRISSDGYEYGESSFSIKNTSTLTYNEKRSESQSIFLLNGTGSNTTTDYYQKIMK